MPIILIKRKEWNDLIKERRVLLDEKECLETKQKNDTIICIFDSNYNEIYFF